MTRFQDPRHPRLAGLPIEAESLENSLAVESLDHADFRGPTPEIRLRSARYRLLREVGRGVSSRVYQALDRKLGRIVAFKRLDRSSSSGLRLLMREVLGAGRLSHPNIVTLFDCGEDRNGPFLTLEWVSGPSLAARLRQGPLGQEQALLLAGQIGAALSHAHRHGVLHRDVKPANVMLRSGHAIAKLTDFGLAAMTGSLLGGANLAGTVPYIAPEVAARGPADHRSDLYSFAVMLGQMLTGELPVRLDDLPASLADVIARALAREPADRYFSIEEMMAALPDPSSGVTHEAPTVDQQAAPAPSPPGPVAVRCPGCRKLTAPSRKFCHGCGMNVSRYVKLRSFLARQQVKYLWSR